MKTNLVSLRLIKQQSGMIRIALKYQNQPNEYESFWVLGKEEIDYAIRRLLGTEPTNFILDDCNYHLKFGTDGILCHDLSNEKVIRNYVTFPGKLLADALETLRDQPYQDDYKRESENVLTVSTAEIDRYAYEFRNRSKVIYHDTEDYSVKNMVINLLRDPLTKDYFTRQLKSFVRQVGEINGKLHLSLDSYSDRNSCYPSLYFWLETSKGQQYYNGGIINHSKDPLTPDYSIHT